MHKLSCFISAVTVVSSCWSTFIGHGHSHTYICTQFLSESEGVGGNIATKNRHKLASRCETCSQKVGDRIPHAFWAICDIKATIQHFEKKVGTPLPRKPEENMKCTKRRTQHAKTHCFQPTCDHGGLQTWDACEEEQMQLPHSFRKTLTICCHANSILPATTLG